MKKTLQAFMLKGGIFICIAALLLTSCENFLKGAETQEQLREAIEIANTDPVTYYVIADKNSGTVNPPQLRLKKKESFDVMFIPADGWEFVCWEVVDRATQKPVENVIKFANPKNLETKGTVLNPRENLMIHPKCTLVPTVTSIEPASVPSGCRQDESIVIKFNKPMNPENFGDFSCILISNEEGKNLFSTIQSQSYFERPRFSDNNTVLTIPTVKGKLLLDKNTNRQLDKITIALNFTTVKDNEGYNFRQNTVYSYYINRETDSVAPVLTDLNVYSTGDVSDPFYKELSAKSFDEWTCEDDYRQNHVGHLYFTLQGYDVGSGVKSVVVEETFKKDVNGNSGTSTAKIKEAKVTLLNDSNLYGADYEFNAENYSDGLYYLKIWINDYSDNSSENFYEYWVVKDTYNILENGGFIIQGYYPTDKNVNDVLPVYNERKQVWEAPLGFIGDNGGVFKEFTVNKDTYYNNYESDRIISIDLYDEDAPQNVSTFTANIGKENDITDTMNNLLAAYRRNVDKTTIFKVIVKEESGVVASFEAAIPKRIDVRGVTLNSAATNGIIMISDYYRPLGYSLTQEVFYTRGVDPTLYKGSANSFTIIPSVRYYNLYVVSNIYLNKIGLKFYMYSALGAKPYKYDKEQTGNNSFTFPDFSLPAASDIEYTENTTAKFTIPVGNHSPDVMINVKLEMATASYCFAEGSVMEVPSTTKYDVSLIAITLDENGNYISHLSDPYPQKLDLTVFDNRKPSLPNKNQIICYSNYFSETNRIRVQVRPQDGSKVKMTSFDCYLIPTYYYTCESFSKSFLEKHNVYKRSVNLGADYPASNKYFYLYTGGIDGNFKLVFYLEDESKNYSIEYMDYDIVRYFIADYSPSVAFNSSGNNIKISAGRYSKELCKSAEAPTTQEFYADFPDDITGSNGFENRIGDKVTITTLGKGETSWVSNAVLDVAMIKESENSWYKTISPTGSNFKGKFMKITGKFSSGYIPNNSSLEVFRYNIFMKPVYVYTDYVYYKGTANEIACNSKGVMRLIDGYQIFTDAPSFVHVCYWSEKLAEDKTDEDISEWEARGYETGILFNDGTSPTGFTYSDTNLAEVPSGWYYATIIHFADGTAKIIDFQQKE